MSDGLGLYIHIPFCAVRCPYCDFNTYAGLDRYFEPYAAALEAEIRQAGARLGHPLVQTIFVGGGTPTVLPPTLLAGVLNTCRETFDVMADAEITSEANPGTVDQAHFLALRAMGVNRLSMGVQSFDEAELRWLGRIHSAAEALDAFAAARTAGFANINLDFMFGLPQQAPSTWRKTLERALALGPEHLSLYSLTVEPGTPLAEWVRRGQVPDTDDDLAADLYLAAQELLAAHGYAHYEISNWARDDAGWLATSAAIYHLPSAISHQPSAICYQPSAISRHQPSAACRHNLIYWRDEPYLGFGAGAHSYDGQRRWWNVRPVPEYIQRMSGGASPVAGDETIDRRLAMGEVMMLGLRLLIEGVTGERFRSRFGVGLEETFGPEIDGLTRKGLLEREPAGVRLTEGGRLLGNQVFARFLPDQDK